MNSDLVFRIILTILFVLVIGTRWYYERESVNTAKEKLLQDKDTGALIIIQTILLTVNNLAMIVYLINPNWMAWSSLVLPDWTRWLGTLVGVADTAILIWTHRILGENFRAFDWISSPEKEVAT